jgi:hypothetical protein
VPAPKERGSVDEARRAYRAESTRTLLALARVAPSLLCCTRVDISLAAITATSVAGLFHDRDGAATGIACRRPTICDAPLRLTAWRPRAVLRSLCGLGRRGRRGWDHERPTASARASAELGRDHPATARCVVPRLPWHALVDRGTRTVWLAVHDVPSACAPAGGGDPAAATAKCSVPGCPEAAKWPEGSQRNRRFRLPVAGRQPPRALRRRGRWPPRCPRPVGPLPVEGLCTARA